ncbi:hypothetical protein ACRAWD_21910 [Caulobacter segnis]
MTRAPPDRLVRPRARLPHPHVGRRRPALAVDSVGSARRALRPIRASSPPPSRTSADHPGTSPHVRPPGRDEGRARRPGVHARRRPHAAARTIAGPGGELWSDLSLLASTSTRIGVPDESRPAPTAVTVEEEADGSVRITACSPTPAPPGRREAVVLHCSRRGEVRARVEGDHRGGATRASPTSTMFGTAARPPMPSGAAGCVPLEGIRFRRRCSCRRRPSPASRSSGRRARQAQLGVVGDAGARPPAHGIFSPPPARLTASACASTRLAGGARTAPHTDMPEVGDWLGVLRRRARRSWASRPSAATRSIDGGFLFRRTLRGARGCPGRADGSSPSSCCARPARRPSAIRDYRDDLAARGWSGAGAGARPAGGTSRSSAAGAPSARCRAVRMSHEGEALATDSADGFRSARRRRVRAGPGAPVPVRPGGCGGWPTADIHPGTVVIDDRWREPNFGTSTWSWRR